MPASRRVGPSSYFDPGRTDELADDTAELVRRRARVLGPAYRLFYEQPLHFVRGRGVHLYDADGHEYLDFYNNVVSLGHAHPRVTTAICQQAAVLNTHTRYLHEAIVTYSEELLTTMPDELGHIMFTCTGSEAGDLALRIAKCHTRGTGIVVTRNAYHGVTTETAAISPSLCGLENLPQWVRVVAAPDASRTTPENRGRLGEWFALQVQEAIDDLETHGIRFAAFVADSILASDGVISDPAGFLLPVREVVSAAGGLYIADEVQPGFGRTGGSMWGFERHSAVAQPMVPDLVTLGKPMGNGMPIAAVAMRPEVVEAFGRMQRYFNTFGGNAVAIAAAQAVLDTLREENLLTNAMDIGGRLRDGLREVATRHPCIGDVRGAGLFVGVELVSLATGEADEALALRVVNDLRRRRVLVAITGPRNNVLKVRPPLVSTTDDCDRFVGELDAVLASDGALAPTIRRSNSSIRPLPPSSGDTE